MRERIAATVLLAALCASCSIRRGAASPLRRFQQPVRAAPESSGAATADVDQQLPLQEVLFTSFEVAVRLRPPPVPVTVKVYVPAVVVDATVSVSVVEFAVVDVGLKLAVTPAGRPVTEKAIAEVKVVRVMFTV
jgi:hypothetical protein